ncbi:MAG: glycosyltransferase family 4 protein, partial [Nitrolancea sp.]
MNGAVLFLSAEYPPMHGGVGDYTGRLVEALAAHDWDVHVLTSSTVHPADQRVLPRVRRWNWDVANVAQQALNETGARIVHIQSQTGAFKMHPAINFLPRRLRKKNPHLSWVTTFHDLLPPYLFPKAGLLRERVTRILATNSDVSIATNERDLERLTIEHRLARRASMIPIGSNLPDIAAVDVQAMRTKIGIDNPEQIAIGFFGFLSEDKGVDMLLDALNQRGWTQPTSLVIIGGGLSAADVANRPYLTWIEERLKACPVQVIETGYLPGVEAAAALRSMDLV